MLISLCYGLVPHSDGMPSVGLESGFSICECVGDLDNIASHFNLVKNICNTLICHLNL